MRGHAGRIGLALGFQHFGQAKGGQTVTRIGQITQSGHTQSLACQHRPAQVAQIVGWQIAGLANRVVKDKVNLQKRGCVGRAERNGLSHGTRGQPDCDKGRAGNITHQGSPHAWMPRPHGPGGR